MQHLIIKEPYGGYQNCWDITGVIPADMQPAKVFIGKNSWIRILWARIIRKWRKI